MTGLSGFSPVMICRIVSAFCASDDIPHGFAGYDLCIGSKAESLVQSVSDPGPFVFRKVTYAVDLQEVHAAESACEL